MNYSKFYTVKYIKVFTKGELKGLNFYSKLSFSTTAQAAKFYKQLNGPNKIHRDLFTDEEYYVIDAKFYMPGELNRHGEVI